MFWLKAFKDTLPWTHYPGHTTLDTLPWTHYLLWFYDYYDFWNHCFWHCLFDFLMNHGIKWRGPVFHESFCYVLLLFHAFTWFCSAGNQIAMVLFWIKNLGTLSTASHTECQKLSNCRWSSSSLTNINNITSFMI